MNSVRWNIERRHEKSANLPVTVSARPRPRTALRYSRNTAKKKKIRKKTKAPILPLLDVNFCIHRVAILPLAPGPLCFISQGFQGHLLHTMGSGTQDNAVNLHFDFDTWSLYTPYESFP